METRKDFGKRKRRLNKKIEGKSNKIRGGRRRKKEEEGGKMG